MVVVGRGGCEYQAACRFARYKKLEKRKEENMDMTPEKAFRQYKEYVEKIKPEGVSVEVRLIHSGEPIVVGTDNAYVKAATRALKKVWGKDTVFIRSGGSIPIVGDFEKHLKIPSVMMGFGLPDDGLHAPNEKFCIANFHRGIESLIEFFDEVGK